MIAIITMWFLSIVYAVIEVPIASVFCICSVFIYLKLDEILSEIKREKP